MNCFIPVRLPVGTTGRQQDSGEIGDFVSNKNGMKKWLSYKHRQYALVSMACPLLTIICVLIYQQLANHDFWQTLETHPDPDNTHVAAMMGIAEVFTLLFFTGIACLIGFLVAVISFKKQRKILGLGTFALLINGLPLIMLLLFFGRAWLRGSF